MYSPVMILCNRIGLEYVVRQVWNCRFAEIEELSHIGSDGGSHDDRMPTCALVQIDEGTASTPLDKMWKRR
jgi:hypothetical protein